LILKDITVISWFEEKNKIFQRENNKKKLNSNFSWNDHIDGAEWVKRMERRKT